MSNYKLTYFGLRGKGELIRLLFATAGIKYTDTRVTFEEWPALKPRKINFVVRPKMAFLTFFILKHKESPAGQLPYLTIDDNMRLVQSASISRYLAEEFKLAGSNNLIKAQANAIVDCMIPFNYLV